jgi:sigma-E factor negative regulatory protein RseC
MTERARILSIKNNTVEVACEEAAGCKSCSGGAFCSVKSRQFEARLSGSIVGTVSEGDLVEILIPPGKTILAGFMVLMVPLILFLCGFAAGKMLLPEAGEGVQALFALAGLGGGFLLAFGYNKLTGRKNLPLVTRLIPL